MNSTKYCPAHCRLLQSNRGNLLPAGNQVGPFRKSTYTEVSPWQIVSKPRASESWRRER